MREHEEGTVWDDEDLETEAEGVVRTCITYVTYRPELTGDLFTLLKEVRDDSIAEYKRALEIERERSTEMENYLKSLGIFMDWRTVKSEVESEQPST